jgi:hypothetical protein
MAFASCTDGPPGAEQRTDCPWGLPCSPRAAQNAAAASSQPEHRTGVLCVEDHEHICADMARPAAPVGRRSVRAFSAASVELRSADLARAGRPLADPTAPRTHGTPLPSGPPATPRTRVSSGWTASTRRTTRRSGFRVRRRLQLSHAADVPVAQHAIEGALVGFQVPIEKVGRRRHQRIGIRSAR